MRAVRNSLLLAAALALAGAGCEDPNRAYFGTTTRTGKAPTTFYLNASAEPQTIDPGRGSEAVGSLFVSHLFEGLSVYHPQDGRPTQGVASSWDKSDDNRLFRFHLRKEAVWSDGKRVTAADFAYAWARVLSPKTASRAAPNLYVLLNGELFSRGLLKITVNRTEVREGPSKDAATVATLPAARAVRVLATEGLYSKITLHDRLPTFNPDLRAPVEEGRAGEEPASLGFVRTADLVESPSVLGLRAVDEDTLEVETERPAPYFLDLTCYPALSPLRRDAVEAKIAAGGPDALGHATDLVHNGAYTISDWKFRYEIVMTKNPTYWRSSELAIDKVVWTMVEDYRSTLNLYKAGELDYLGDNSSIPSEAMPFVSNKKDFLRSFYLNVYWFELNTRKPPLDDVRVRRALNLAIDKAQLIERVVRGGQIPATHYVPDFAGSGYSEAVAADRKAGTDPFSGPGTSFDPEQARALLREAGYEIAADGNEFKAKGFPPLELLYNTGEGHRSIAVAIQDYWRRHLGVSVNLRNEEWKVLLKNAEQHEFQIVRGGWIADYNHPQTWLDTFLSYSPQNHSGWGDAEFDRMLREAAATADPARSIQRFRAAEKRAVDAMAKIPLYFYTRSVLVKPWVKGFYPNPRNVHLAQWLSIDTGKSDSRPPAEPRDFAPPGAFSKAREQGEQAP